MRNRSFALDGNYVGARRIARSKREANTAVDRLRVGGWYWLAIIAAIVAGACWRAYAPGARAPGLSAMVFLLMIAALYVFIAFPVGVACAVVSVRWSATASFCLLLSMAISGAIAAMICSIGRMQPEWDVLALYGGIVAALAMQVFMMTRKAWLNDRD
jgi:hypothetical protein